MTGCLGLHSVDLMLFCMVYVGTLYRPMDPMGLGISQTLTS